jgi:hypothetical protein
LSETKLPKFLHELAAMDKLPRGAYVDLPDKSAAWFVESVQMLADEVYTVNHRQDVLFTGFESVVIYFNVRSFAEVMREIFTHRLIDVSKGKSPTAKHFISDNGNSVTDDIARLRKLLEEARKSELQKSAIGVDKSSVGDVPDIWAFALAAYQAYTMYNRRFDDVMAMSLSKLARGASEIGQQIQADAIKKGEAAYFWQKR